MVYVITSACKDEQAADCVEECPVNCIIAGPNQYYINPDQCIECGACESVCPVHAIYPEEFVPEAEKEFVVKNAVFFK